jgi:hypothetical protein
MMRVESMMALRAVQGPSMWIFLELCGGAWAPIPWPQARMRIALRE